MTERDPNETARPELSVVVVSYRSPGALLRCLESLEAGVGRTKRRRMTDSAIFRLEKALEQLLPAVPSIAAAR